MGRNNMYFVIDGRLPSLNEYINAERSNRYKGAKLKKDTERAIKLYMHSLLKKRKSLKKNRLKLRKRLNQRQTSL